MIYIVGCDHYLQPYELREWMEEWRPVERDLKERFYNILEELIKTKAVAFVGEECKRGENTILRALAQENGCEYSEIDMPMETRRECGIPDDYEQQDDAVKARCYGIREDHMANRVLEGASNTGTRLVVCGSRHVEGLARRFRERGQQVETRDVLMEGWFDPPYKRMLRGEL